MIHAIEIGPDTEPKELLKQLRKKLMTGGAVLRLRPGLSAADQELVFEKFSGEATAYNAFGEVLVQLAGLDNISMDLRIKLEQLNLRNVTTVLRRVVPIDTPPQ